MSPASDPTPTAAATPLLRAENLCASYGSSQVLFGIDMEVPVTGGVAILGRNGAGKTTLLKTLVGELRAHDGSVTFDGKDITHAKTEHRIADGVAYVPQEQAVFGGLSVRENLEVGALLKGKQAEIDRVVTMFPKLGQRMGQMAATLSGGERKMLAIGRAILSQPRLLLLDEPTEGVWVGVIEEIAERLQEMSKTMAVVIVEQHVELALRIADHAYVMGRGTMALHGAAEDIRDDPKLVQYLAP